MERSDLMIKSLAVYCGAHLGNDPIYQARAAAFGKKMRKMALNWSMAAANTEPWA